MTCKKTGGKIFKDTFKIGVIINFPIFTRKYLMTCNFIKKETLTKVFSCEYYKMFGKSLFYGTHPVAASENGWRISRNF